MIGLVAAVLRWPDGESGQGAIPIEGTKDCSAVVARAVLICMAEHANAHHITYPSAETIARETGLSVRAVKRAKALLEAHGYLEVIGLRSGGGPGSSTRYKVTIGQATSANHDAPDTVADPNYVAPDMVKGTKGTNGQLAPSNCDECVTGDECGHNCAATGHNCDECGHNYVAPDTRTPTNPHDPPGSVGGGVGSALALAAHAAAPSAGEERAAEEETILETILAALPVHGHDAGKLLVVIRDTLSTNVPGEQIIAAATSGPSHGVKSWTGVLTKRIREARWHREAPEQTDDTIPAGDVDAKKTPDARTKPDPKKARRYEKIASQTTVDVDQLCEFCRRLLDTDLGISGGGVGLYDEDVCVYAISLARDCAEKHTTTAKAGIAGVTHNAHRQHLAALVDQANHLGGDWWWAIHDMLPLYQQDTFSAETEPMCRIEHLEWCSACDDPSGVPSGADHAIEVVPDNFLPDAISDVEHVIATATGTVLRWIKDNVPPGRDREAMRAEVPGFKPATDANPDDNRQAVADLTARVGKHLTGEDLA